MTEYDPVTDGIKVVNTFPATTTATITSGDATGLSTEIDMRSAKYIGLIMPATWTTAVITFKVSDTTGGTYTDLYDDNGTEVSVNVAQAKAYTFNITTWKIAPWRFIKIRSGTTATPVAQGGNRTITLVLK